MNQNSIKEIKRIVMNGLIRLFNKTFGINSVSCPWGSCTEDFLLSKAIKTLEKSEIDLDDKNNLAKLLIENMYHNRGRYSNGKHAGEWYISIIKKYYNSREREKPTILVVRIAVYKFI